MIVGVKQVICTCGKPMGRTGGQFGEVSQDTYYCIFCKKHVIIITPKETAQKEFTTEFEKMMKEL